MVRLAALDQFLERYAQNLEEELHQNKQLELNR